MNVIFRYSFASCVFYDFKKAGNTEKASYYFENTNSSPWLLKAARSLDISQLPGDYNGDNYDLIFDPEGDLIHISKDLDTTYELIEK